MIDYVWKFKELFQKDNVLTHVNYSLTGTDGVYSVTSEGFHEFLPETVDKPFHEILESDIKTWIQKDTTQNEVNLLKSNIESQINYLKNSPKKADFPWLSDTFTIE